MAETPPQHGRPALRRGDRDRMRFDDEDIGSDALQFGRWFVKDRFSLMEGFLAELEKDPRERDTEALRERFLHATKHARTVLMVRGVVTALLALSVATTAVSALLDNLAAVNETYLPSLFAIPVDELRSLLFSLQAIAAAAALVLLVARLVCDRYLELVQVTATYTAMQLASSPRAWSGAYVGARRA